MTDNRSSSLHSSKRVLALCGGVGGAKLAQGLNELITTPDSLTIGIALKRLKSWARKAGLHWATATWPCTLSAATACVRARRCRKSPP